MTTRELVVAAGALGGRLRGMLRRPERRARPAAKGKDRARIRLVLLGVCFGLAYATEGGRIAVLSSSEPEEPDAVAAWRRPSSALEPTSPTARGASWPPS